MDETSKRIKELYNYLMESCPDFRKFVKDNENKTIEDLALEYDIDIDILQSNM